MCISPAGSRRDTSDKGMAVIKWNCYTACAFDVRFFTRTRTLGFCVIFDGKDFLVFFVDISTLVSKSACAVFREEVTNNIAGLCSVRAGLRLILCNVCLMGLPPWRGIGRGESERPRAEPLLDPGLPPLGKDLLGDPVLEPRGLSDRPRPAFSLSCRNGQSRPDAHLPCSNH